MNFSKIAVKRPVTTSMVILIAIAFGFLSINNLKLDMMPNMNIPIAVVSTNYSGTGPSEMENLITVPLEGVLGTVAGIKNITSSSSNGNSLIVLEFENGTDIDMAALDMREKIDLIKDFLPDGADSPVVMKIDMNSMTSLSIGISSKQHNLVELKQLVDDKIVNRIERQDGVASVNVSGGKEKEIAIILNEEKLRGYGVSESQIIQFLMAENRNIPTGSIKQGSKSLQLRVGGEFKDVEEIRNLPITSPTGATIALRDVADISETFKESISLSYINGIPSVTLSIQKQSTANTVNVSNAVLKELDKIKADLPQLEVKVILNPADFVTMTLSTVASSAIYGGLLAVIILFIFLKDIRSTLVVAAAMPISIITTFVLMYYANITLNVMSLGGLALGIGMLVDNSIVVLESIFRKVEEGEDRITAAIEGAREVAMSVIASTLTTVAVFLPITFSGGLTAEIFNQLALTVAFSLISSLAVALTFVPMACSLILKTTQSNKPTNKLIKTIMLPLDVMSSFIEWIEKAYQKALAVAIKRRILTLIVTFSFVVLTFLSLNFVPMEFLPATDESGVTISISLPKGSLLSQTEKVTNSVLEKISSFEEVTDITYTVGGLGAGVRFGGSSTDEASINVILVNKNERTKSSDDVAREMSKALKDISGAKITCLATTSSMGQFAGGSSIQLYVKGSELNRLMDIAEDFKEIISNTEGMRDVKTSVEESSPQATIVVNRAKAMAYGISPTTISSIINTAVSGTVATTYKIAGDEYDIRVFRDKASLDFISDVKNILIPTPQGTNIPILEVAEIKTEYLPVAIERENQQKYISITGNLDGKTSGEMSKELETLLNQYNMPDGYSWAFSGDSERMMETFAGLGIALLLAVALVYMIMAAEFESLIYPFIVMFSIPIALTGGLFGLFVTGVSLNITSYLGLIMLAGIVINNAIVLIDYINLLIKERGMSVTEAILTAGPVRLRPILMSVLTTVLGLLPMVITKGQGSELMAGLGTVVVFGLTLSTLVTLLLIPTIYAMIRKNK